MYQTPLWCDRHGSYACCQHPFRHALVTALLAGSMLGIVVGLFVVAAFRTG
jgi:hypothetical protein